MIVISVKSLNNLLLFFKVITGATEQVVESADEALSCLDAGAAGRHVGSTNMNEHSSRSHAIFTLYIGELTSCS